MKHRLLVLLTLGLAITSGTPAWARAGMHGRGPAGGVRGFTGRSPVSVAVPVTTALGARGAIVVPRGMGPGAGAASTPVSVRTQPVQPKMIVIDSFGRPQVVASSGSVAAAPSVIRSSDPKVIVMSAAATAPLTSPKIIEVNPAGVSQRVAAKLIVVRPSVVSRRRGLTLIGIAVSALGPQVLLGPPCDFGAGLPESCAPLDSAALVVEAAPADAQVLLDGQLLGTASDLSGQPLVIPAGPHGLEIASPGAGPFRLEFTATPGTPTRIHAGLVTP